MGKGVRFPLIRNNANPVLSPIVRTSNLADVAFNSAYLLRVRIFAALLLAAIGLQVVEPIRTPLQLTQGSAFSAATLDVAVVSSRKGEAEAYAPLPIPPLTSAPAMRTAPKPSRFIAVSSSRLQPDVRGPPPRSHPAFPPDSTAPPIA